MHERLILPKKKKCVEFSILFHSVTIYIRVYDSFTISAPIFQGKVNHFGGEHFCAVVKLSEQFLKYLVILNLNCC